MKRTFKEIVTDFIEDVDSWTWKYIREPYYHLTERIIGTFEYAKFIWKSEAYREWDFAYLYDIIEFKLKRMAKQLGEDDFVKDSSERVKEINTALALLDRFNNIEDDSSYLRDEENPTIEEIKKIYTDQQKVWEDFHDQLKNHARGWWS